MNKFIIKYKKVINDKDMLIDDVFSTKNVNVYYKSEKNRYYNYESEHNSNFKKDSLSIKSHFRILPLKGLQNIRATCYMISKFQCTHFHCLHLY